MKVAICTPCHGDPKLGFLLSMVGLTNHRIENVDVRLFVVSSAILPQARNVLVAQAREWGADWILWIDADMTFPPDTLSRLLARNVPVVGANCVRRQTGQPSTAYIGQTPVATTEEKVRSGSVEQVSALGLGLCLTNTSIFERLPEPWFLFGYDRDRKIAIGEDSFLFGNLLAAKIPVYVDHAVSWEIGHIAETVLKHQAPTPAK
ncbi:MAG TPA: glycosyltransferase family A protein [Allosphingosinicella sp.]|jgi:glycosyltransferase involved in cell wall biosynthesis